MLIVNFVMLIIFLFIFRDGCEECGCMGFSWCCYLFWSVWNTKWTAHFLFIVIIYNWV